MGRLFGTDGVRGRANVDLTPELALSLGNAVAHVLAGESETPAIAMGRDTRISGDLLEAALTAGICAGGVDVYRLGVLPTPAIAYLTRHLKADAGAVISASHNPYEDNGIKFFNRLGFKLPDELEDEIEQWVRNGSVPPLRATDGDIGRVIDFGNAREIYAQHLVKTFRGSLEHLHIVLDCANGAASEVGPEVLRALGARLTVINNQPNGVNINENCGSTHLDLLKEEVIRRKADLGLAHDGDADRVLAVDETGGEVDGDRMLVICGRHLARAGALKNNTVVVTVMSNLGLMRAFAEDGIGVEVTTVGDRYVLERMLEKDCTLGGEQSGHLIFLDQNTTGDGLLTSLHLLQVMVESGQKLSELAAQMEVFPQVQVSVPVPDREKAMADPVFREAVEEARTRLGENGRILVRPSGTESKIRIMAEGEDPAQLDQMVRDLRKLVGR